MRSLVALLAVATVAMAAMPLPDLLPYRYRSGALYQAALESVNGYTYNQTANYFDQLIDHSNPALGTFKQRFFVDFSYWDGTGPAVLYISGEQIAYGSPRGFLQNYSKSIGALMFTLEHRWYGGSPVGAYNNTALLKTLTVNNALHDMNTFMNYVDATFIGKKLRWFSCGGSYAGALSAWLKVTFPDRIVAAWSSSGVVNPRFDYYNYEGHIVSVLSPACNKALQAVYQQIYATWDSPIAFAAMQTLFNVSDYTRPEFEEMIADAYSGLVQYGQRVLLCTSMLPLSSNPLQQFAALVGSQSGPEFAARKKADRTSPAMVDMSGFLWNYQCCTQMAFWQVGYPANGRSECIRPTNVSTDYFMNFFCNSTYGPSVFPDVFAFNQQMGGATPNAVNVIALQGSDDPFGPAGVNQQVNPNYPFVMAQCTDCGHCGDLGVPRPTDPLSLTQQRMKIVQYMNLWLGYTNNVTFFTAQPATVATVQAALLAALSNYTWVDAMVFECAGTTCFASFPKTAVAERAMALAAAGTISGVVGAGWTPPKQTTKPIDNGNIGKSGVLLGVLFGLIAVLAVGAIVAYFRRQRQLKEAGLATHFNDNESVQ